MMRIVAVLALLPVICADVRAQIIIRTNPPIHSRPRPIGVIPPPMLPVTRTVALATPTPVLGHRRFGSRFFVNPYYALWGYPPVWPAWDGYQTTPTIVNNYVPVPVAPPVQPAPPPELRAQLTLQVPPGSTVWLAGKEVDAAVSPLVLESPVLNEGQSYSFDVKVKWIEGRNSEQRARRVTVAAGESKSLTYIAAR